MGCTNCLPNGKVEWDALDVKKKEAQEYVKEKKVSVAIYGKYPNYAFSEFGCCLPGDLIELLLVDI
jgi:Tfp pilus assembly protein PilO